MNKITFTILTLVGFALISFGLSFIVAEEQNKVSIIPVKGAISSTGSGSPLKSIGASSTKILDKLDKAEKDDTIKAIVLEIDSPGGAVIPSKEIMEKVLESEKTTIAWIRGSGASGAYWIASAADHVVADELSIIGSIGVTSSYLEFSDLFEEYGVTYQRLVTGKFKDTKSPFKQMTPEEEKAFMKKLYVIHDYFAESVATNRNLSANHIKTLATGEIFLGQEAFDIGLIDELGGEEEAINASEKLSGFKDLRVVKHREPEGLLSYLVSSQIPFQIGQGMGSAFLSVKDQRPEIKL